MPVDISVVEAAFADATVKQPYLSGWRRKGKRKFIRTVQDIQHTLEMVLAKNSWEKRQTVFIRAGISFPCAIEPIYPSTFDGYKDGVATCSQYLLVNPDASNPMNAHIFTSEEEVAIWAPSLAERIQKELISWLDHCGSNAASAVPSLLAARRGLTMLHVALAYEGAASARERLLDYLACCPTSRPDEILFTWAAAQGLLDQVIAKAMYLATIQMEELYRSQLIALVAQARQ
jgi:hypothetical protein